MVTKQLSNIESLRGFAALFVVLIHIVTCKAIFNAQFSPDILNRLTFPSHIAVLVFFMLSGYVIGISNKKEFDWAQIKIYLKKRVIRIYPIYFVCVVFAFLVASHYYGHYTILVNLFFLQGPLSYIVEENSPIWSLNYEVLYYLLFIPLAYFKFNLRVVIAVALVIGILNFFLYPRLNAPIISSYLFGYCFWVAGLWLSKKQIPLKQEKNFSLLTSNLLLMCCLVQLNSNVRMFDYITMLLAKTTFSFPNTLYFPLNIVPFSDFAYLPYCILFIVNFAGIQFKYKKYFAIILQVIPLFTFLYLGINAQNYTGFLFSIIAYALSTLLFLFKMNYPFFDNLIKAGAWLGKISYSVYIVHFPMLFLFGKAIFMQQTLPSYSLKLILYFISIIGISYVLENKFQVWIKRYFIVQL